MNKRPKGLNLASPDKAMLALVMAALAMDDLDFDDLYSDDLASDGPDMTANILQTHRPLQ